MGKQTSLNKEKKLFLRSLKMEMLSIQKPLGGPFDYLNSRHKLNLKTSKQAKKVFRGWDASQLSSCLSRNFCRFGF